MKNHQRKLHSRVCLGATSKLKERNRNKENEKDTSSSKVDPIPVDLEVEILTRLPVKSLMKFRCVSKMWSSIIQSKRFVGSYYALSSTQPRLMIAFSCAYAENDARHLFIFSSSYEKEESSSLVANLDMTIPSAKLDQCFSKGPSVHGFVGCPNGTSEFIVCNPSTGQVITLPVKGLHTYLGYDPVENQFKALTYVCNHISFLEFEVTILGGGGESPWRRNKVTSPPFLHISKNLCINGFVYWAAWEPSRRVNPVIVCFDVRFETLSFIKVPKDVVVWESESIWIEYKGKLASIARHPYVSFLTFDLWILVLIVPL